ncbi:MAG: TlyA family RNA methyltransferase [Acutalibacteraceae bacterium]
MAERLDVYLCEKGLVESREKGKALIMAGIVFVNNQKVDKPGFQVKEEANVEIRGETLKYVSRGGLKLEKAMENFQITLKDKICADIGASTGGFTDCMLQNGAKKVYSIDVGYGQLAWKLRTDERVVNLERTNFRYCTNEQVPDELDFASVDVSFISLTKILPVMQTLMKKNAESVCLIKPQFEAGKEKVGKKGVVREASTHLEVVNKIIDFAVSIGFSVENLEFSPIKGPQGNIEYLIHIKNDDKGEFRSEITAEELINQSHIELS